MKSICQEPKPGVNLLVPLLARWLISTLGVILKHEFQQHNAIKLTGLCCLSVLIFRTYVLWVQRNLKVCIAADVFFSPLPSRLKTPHNYWTNRSNRNLLRMTQSIYLYSLVFKEIYFVKLHVRCVKAVCRRWFSPVFPPEGCSAHELRLS